MLKVKQRVDCLFLKLKACLVAMGYTHALLNLGLTQFKYDPTLNFKFEGSRLVGAINTHVDNLAVVGEPQFVSSISKVLDNCFEVSSDEELHHFL